MPTAHYITVAGEGDSGQQPLDSFPTSYKTYYPLWGRLCPRLVGRTLVL